MKIHKGTLEKVIKLLMDAGKKGNPLKCHTDQFRQYVSKGDLLKELRTWREK